jgi:hypothetical protein
MTLHHKTVEYIGKIQHSKLSKKAKWKAANMILDAQIQYPLMATLCTYKELEKIDWPIIHYKCTALGLHEHFPWPPTKISKMATQRIN